MEELSDKTIPKLKPDEGHSTDWGSLRGGPRKNSAKRRRRCTADQTMRDGSPLRRPEVGERELTGHLMHPYGAPLRADTFEHRPDDLIRGMVQGGHGFTVNKAETPTPIVVSCRYCGGPLRPPDLSVEWFCEFPEPMEGCQCNWCLERHLWMAGQYRGRGRPRVQCGSRECSRALAAERQRRRRATGMSRLIPKGEGEQNLPGQRGPLLLPPSHTLSAAPSAREGFLSVRLSVLIQRDALGARRGVPEPRRSSRLWRTGTPPFFSACTT